MDLHPTPPAALRPEQRPLRLTLRQLSVFVAVAQHGSTMAAAQALAMSQSAVSASLAELERALDSPLFDRIARRLSINETGRQFFPRALSLLDQAQELERFAGQTGVQLRIAASNTIGSYMLPPLLAGFRHSRSGPCTLDLRIGNTREVLQSLLQFEADIGLVEGASHERDLRSVRWCDDEMVVIVGPSHPLAAAPHDLVALRDAEWIVREPGSGTREVIEERLVPLLGELRFALELGNAEAIKRAVMSGFGVSCLSLHVVRDELERGTLVAIREGLPRIVRPLQLVVHQDKFPTQGLLAFTEYLRTMAPRIGA
ncbi:MULTISPECIES: LysR family transcriptional regulator [Cupriavidus]|uniref:LysR family transcriptional regulator n=1 Tax=Cupriavidus TaxID=106589 RepID=UPI000E194E87|nr:MULTISPECIES: LysR family transcriptional regulator [Cupriavidus]MEC3769102.1 LysR family transcriptional regulator [Cupriavidus sp. SS-3]SOY80868.1 putative transcriptional regulator, LysR family [Cupriavidus taiwanensis]SOY81970.1 putative transcriptional regulator, LysR family [Cupriavidus taiwanensis]